MKTATEDEVNQLASLTSEVLAEGQPERPETPADLVQTWRGRPTFQTAYQWMAVRSASDHLVGAAELDVWRSAHNQHIANFSIGVAPAMRLQGIATQLLQEIAAAASREKPVFANKLVELHFPGRCALFGTSGRFRCSRVDTKPARTC